MASPPFSAHDVYTILVDDDVAGLERVVFSLGHRLHKLRVWSDCTPVLYAARLAHAKQLQILVLDLEQYGPRPLNNLWLDIWTNSMARIDEEKDKVLSIVSWLINRMPIEYVDEFMLAAVQERAFDVIEVLLKENERLIFRLVRVCLQEKRKELFQLPAWVVNHELFTKTLQQCQAPPLEPIIAMLRGDTEALKRCFAHRFASGKLDPMKIIIRNAILVNDTAVTNAVLEEEIVSYVVSENQMSEQEVFVTLLDGAEKGQACSVVKAVISNPRFDKSRLHWMDRYYENILHGRVSVANCIKPLVDFSNQERKDEIFESISSTDYDHSFLDSESISVQDMVQIIDALISLRPEACDEGYLSRVKNFPYQHVRPDLIETVRERIGLDYSESDVLNTEENSRYLMSPRMEFRRSDTGGRLSNLRNPDEFLGAFLDPSHTITVEPLFPGQLPQLENYLHIERGLSETGMTLDTQSWIRLNHCDVQPCPSLRQTCRTAVRKLVVDRHCTKVFRTSITDYSWKCEFGRVMDDLVSLYSDGLLPKELVDYLLYRNGNSPFYYTLFSALM